MKKFRLIGILAVLLVALLIAGCLPNASNGEDPAAVEKAFSVVVIHGDGSEKTFQYVSSQKYLGAALMDEGLVEGEEGPYGLYIKTVDGEKAVYEEDSAYWGIFIGEESAVTGADQILVEDGAVYKLVYTAA